MHSGCRGTAVPNVCLQAFTLSLVPRWTKGLFTGYPSGTPRSTGLSLRYFAQIRFKTSQTSRRKSYVFKLPQKYVMVYRVERLGDIEKQHTNTLRTGNTEIGLQFFTKRLSSALFKGVSRATFHKAGTAPSVIDLLIRYVIERASSTSAFLNNLAGILSTSPALSTFNEYKLVNGCGVWALTITKTVYPCSLTPHQNGYLPKMCTQSCSLPSIFLPHTSQQVDKTLIKTKDKLKQIFFFTVKTLLHFQTFY